MASALNDTYEVVLRSLNGEVDQRNVFNYRLTLDGSESLEADALAEAFRDNVVADIADITGEDVNYYQVDVRNFRDLTDFMTLPIDVDGQRAGNSAPTGVSLSLTWYTNTRALYRGGKRFGGMSEDDVNQNLLSSGYRTAVEATLATFTGVLAGSDGSEFRQVLMKRPLPTIAVPGIGTSAIVNQAVIAGIGSQNSRKRLLRAG